MTAGPWLALAGLLLALVGAGAWLAAALGRARPPAALIPLGAGILVVVDGLDVGDGAHPGPGAPVALAGCVMALIALVWPQRADTL